MLDIALESRARLITEFLEADYQTTLERLQQGFHHNHAEVAHDFESDRPMNDDDLLEWYRSTDAYVHELSIYHHSPQFNYHGMCQGIATHLLAENKQKVLCLGDGVGDLSLWLYQAGLEPTYHDLAGSKTAGFARYLFQNSGGNEIQMMLTRDWKPPLLSDQDAVVALDFFEHLVNVEEWAQFVVDTLHPGGIFLAQNAFAIGDDDHGGSIPMHLTRNNRFEHDWASLLESLGLVDLKNGWWQKPC